MADGASPKGNSDRPFQMPPPPCEVRGGLPRGTTGVRIGGDLACVGPPLNIYQGRVLMRGGKGESRRREGGSVGRKERWRDEGVREAAHVTSGDKRQRLWEAQVRGREMEEVV